MNLTDRLEMQIHQGETNQDNEQCQSYQLRRELDLLDDFYPRFYAPVKDFPGNAIMFGAVLLYTLFKKNFPRKRYN